MVTRAVHCATLDRTYQTQSVARNAYRDVYLQLADRTWTLSPGSHLGREVDLCRELGVGKSALRHALNVLRADGLIATFPGRGHIVTGKRSDSLLIP